MTTYRTPIAATLLMLAACGGEPATGTASFASTELPVEGSCEALAMVEVANTATFAQLDDDMKLHRYAAENIVAERPFNKLSELDAVSWVGNTALSRILKWTKDEGHLDHCDAAPSPVEIGILSDLDKTVVPPADPDLSKVPYPGVTTLYQILEHRQNGAAGDMYYVTARTPDGVVDMPDYLEEHGVPAGPIETGVSGLPWVAEPEKVADVTGILEATGDQKFVLLGDSSHRDPEVYQTIIELFPERIIAGFIHKVNNTVSPHRVEGLHLHTGYAEVAAILYGYEVITREEAREVMDAAADEGAELTEDAMEALLDEHAPDAG